MRRIKTLIAAALVAASLGFATAQERRDPLLFAAIVAPANVSYAGVVQVVHIGSRASEADVYRVEHRAPDLTRRDYEAPAALAGDTVVSKGDLTFSLDSPRHRIVEARNDAVGDPRVLSSEYALLSENYRVVRRGDDSVAGRHTVDLALINRYSGRMTMLVRVDAASKVALDREEFGPSGALVSEMRFEQISYPAQVTEADFSLPKNVAVVRDPTLAERPERPGAVVTSAGFAAHMPRELPAGFAPVEGDFVELNGVRMVHLLYSDGIRTFSLFESAKASKLDAAETRPQAMRIGGRSGEYAEDNATGVLSWSDGALQYTLVGEVGLVDLTHLAESITP
jgi:negative regulator of sigma E activity